MANPSDSLPILIGLNGFKGVGKDTAADVLVNTFGFTKVAFAAKLKQAAGALFDCSPTIWDHVKNDPNVKISFFDEEVGDMYSELTTREFLQRFGTEMGRDVFGKDFWVDQTIPSSSWSVNRSEQVDTVICDARFENELSRIRTLGGYNIRIERPGFKGDGHGSEVKPPDELIDFTIYNSWDIPAFIGAVSQAFLTIKGNEYRTQTDQG